MSYTAHQFYTRSKLILKWLLFRWEHPGQYHSHISGGDLFILTHPKWNHFSQSSQAIMPIFPWGALQTVQNQKWPRLQKGCCLVRILHRSARRKREKEINSRYNFDILRQGESQQIQMLEGVDLHRTVPLLNASKLDDTVIHHWIALKEILGSRRDWVWLGGAFEKN